jgi:tyrosine-protein kinase Etk/Wzc
MTNPTDAKMQQHSEVENIDLAKIFSKLFDKWYWFLASIVVFLLAAFLYLRYTAPTYQIDAKLLINDEGKSAGTGGAGASALMDLGGLFGGKSSVDNEAEILQTRFLLEQVVRELQLNIIYGRKSGFSSREMYNSPFRINIINAVDTIQSMKLDIEKSAGNKLKITSKNFEKDAKLNQIFRVPGIGQLQVIEDPVLKMDDGQYYASLSSIDECVDDLLTQLSIAVTNKQVTIIDLSLSSPIPKKGEDILNTLINKYTQTNLNDKNAIADSTYKFIEQRLNIIATELGDVENKVENFKQRNKLADMSEQSKLLVQNTGGFTADLAKAETQVSILNDLENYLKDESKNKRIFPTSLLPTDAIFSDLMAQYNTLLIERDKQLLSVTEGSPFVKNIDDQITGLRRSILANIQSTKNNVVLTRNKLRSQLSTVENQIGGVPEIEKSYVKLARNQKIKEELYIFLMQKAEETAISKSSNIPVGKLIDPPKSKVKPVSPKRMTVYSICLFLGLAFPFALIFILDMLKTTISAKEDITGVTSVPVIGEISHNDLADNLISAHHGRSAISEQFRALRTNLSFYLKNKDEKVILLTSSMSGEGKSFTAINLGIIMALAGKRVVLMELDLRKPGLSAKFNMPNHTGFSNFTINSDLTVKDIIKPLEVSKNMFLVSSGPLPPNPAETLLSDRTALLIDQLKEQYDYVIMDAPPIGIITDAQLLSQFADVTIYMVRQKITQKSQLKIVEELHQSGKMKNLGIVVNDIVNKEYGYGYGYGNYGNEQPGNWYQRLIKQIKK